MNIPTRNVARQDWTAILDAMSEGVAIVDAHDQLLHANRAFYDLLKQPYGAGLGASLETLLHPTRKTPSCVVCAARQHGQAGRFKLHPFEAVNPTGKSLEVTIEPVRDAQGALLEVIEMMRDVSDIERSEQRFVQLFESAADGIVLQDPATFAIVDANQRACELFGYTKEEFAGLPFSQLVQDNEMDTVQAAIHQLRQAGAMRLETTIARKDGLLVPVEVSARLIVIGADPIIQIILRDITERRMVERVLQEQSELAQQLSEATLRAQEDERRRIARELHDGIGQTLTALKFRLEVLRYKSPAEAHTTLPQLSDAVGEAVAALRNLAMQLRPSHLDDMGLVEALRWHVEQFTQHTGIRATLTAGELGGPLAGDVCVHLYRLVQEALTNVCKHARAAAVNVQLSLMADHVLRLVIHDNGTGFDPASVRQEAGHFHVGLSSMRERIGMIHGTLAIISQPGQGTTITAEIPLRPGGIS